MLTDYRYFIFTSDPDELVKFYLQALDCKIIRKLEYELDYGYTIEISEGGNKIWIAKHSEVNGKNKDPYRHILNIYTDNIHYYLDKIRVYPKAKIIAEPFSMGTIIPGETRYACTFLDPEDNCLQLMGKLQ